VQCGMWVIKVLVYTNWCIFEKIHPTNEFHIFASSDGLDLYVLTSASYSYVGNVSSEFKRSTVYRFRVTVFTGHTRTDGRTDIPTGCNA